MYECCFLVTIHSVLFVIYFDVNDTFLISINYKMYKTSYRISIRFFTNVFTGI